MLSLQAKVSWFIRIQRAMLFAVIALTLGFYAFAYRPLTSRMASLKNQIGQAREELRSAQSQTTMLPVVEADVERLQLRLQKFKSLSKLGEQGQFVNEISQMAQRAGLRKDPLTSNSTIVKSDRVWEEPYELALDGDFKNVFAFLRHTEELQRLTRTSKLNIKSIDKLGQVKVQLTMSIYYLAE